MHKKSIITISIVSHLQGNLVKHLLDDLQKYCPDSIEVLLTVNSPENLPFEEADFRYPLRIVRNEAEKGFGANHNTAFLMRKGSLFCIINPDVRLLQNPFGQLVRYMEDPSVGIVAPMVLDENLSMNVSARKFPTMSAVLRNFLGIRKPDYSFDTEPICVDWTAGMFMLFNQKAYEDVRGFDEGYYLYYEDVDICARIWQYGYKVLYCPSVSIIHYARFQSHYSLRYFKWHICSLTRYMLTRTFGTAAKKNPGGKNILF